MHMKMYDAVQKENLLCKRYRESSWFANNFYVFKKANSPDDDRLTSDCQSLLDSLMGFFETQGLIYLKCLVQFWAAEQVVVNTTVHHTNYRLTTTNHPFLLRGFWFSDPNYEELCRYRMKTCDVIVPGDGGGGAIGRVFRNKRIEYSPYIAYYSSQEYPLRDLALSCNIKHSIVVPWFDSYGKVVGVIEFVSTWDPYNFAKILGFFDRYLSSSLLSNDSMNGLETSMEDTSMEFVPVASASTVQSEFYVTIKANYGEDRPIIFQLSRSSGIHELYRQLSQRLELVDGTYDLKYLDEENDLIELTCDEDLQFYISNSVEHEIFTLMVLIVPK